jgi:hypothetical protein
VGRGGRFLKGFFDSITPDAWIQSISSLFGAFLAGGFALWVLIKQIKNEKEQKKKNENENFLRLFYSVINTLELANFLLKIFVRKIHMSIDESDKQRYADQLIEHSNDLDKVAENSIPLHLLKDFYEIKRVIRYFITPFNDYGKLDNLTDEEKQDIIKQIEKTKKEDQIKAQKKVEKFLGEFKEYASSIKK